MKNLPMDCDKVLALAPTYVDGELSDAAEASQLRAHLIDCPDCRSIVQDEKTLRQWFVASDEVPVPEGFAARVADLAFAGSSSAVVSAVVSSGNQVAASAQHATRGPANRSRLRLVGGRSSLASFQMALATAAAALLIAVSLVLARSSSNEVDTPLDAAGTLQEQLDRLEEMNRAEGGQQDAQNDLTGAPEGR